MIETLVVVIFVIFITNISVFVKNCQLSESLDELTILNKKNEIAYKTLREEHDFLKDIRHTLNHDIKTPLTIIFSIFGMLEDDIEEDWITDGLSKSLKGIESIMLISSMINCRIYADKNDWEMTFDTIIDYSLHKHPYMKFTKSIDFSTIPKLQPKVLVPLMWSITNTCIKDNASTIDFTSNEHSGITITHDCKNQLDISNIVDILEYYKCVVIFDINKIKIKAINGRDWH
jgi:hypothetical protein